MDSNKKNVNWKQLTSNATYFPFSVLQLIVNEEEDAELVWRTGERVTTVFVARKNVPSTTMKTTTTTFSNLFSTFRSSLSIKWVQTNAPKRNDVEHLFFTFYALRNIYRSSIIQFICHFFHTPPRHFSHSNSRVVVHTNTKRQPKRTHEYLSSSTYRKWITHTHSPQPAMEMATQRTHKTNWKECRGNEVVMLLCRTSYTNR